MAKDTVPSKLPVTFANIPHLSEAYAKIIDREIQEAFRDCNNRPKLKKPRVVKMEIHFTPIVDEEDDDADCQEVNVAYVVHPVGRPKSIPQDSVVKINKQNQGFFHADFPGDPNAIGLFDEQSAKPKK